MNIAYNMDCMEYMRTLQDKTFDLAVVDPPYGIGMDGGVIGGSVLAKNTNFTKKIGTSSRRRRDTLRSSKEYPKIRLYLAPTILCRRLRKKTAHAGSCGTKTTAITTSRIANLRTHHSSRRSENSNIAGKGCCKRVQKTRRYVFTQRKSPSRSMRGSLPGTQSREIRSLIRT